MALSRDELRQLALAGARTRLQELETERRTLLREFPELGTGQRKLGASSAQRQVRRRNLTPAQRKAISKRMTALWAERRKAKGKAA